MTNAYDLAKTLTDDQWRLVGAAFHAGYHCQWIKGEMRYIFDHNMTPGDANGAFWAWLCAYQLQGVAPADPNQPEPADLLRGDGQ